MRGGGAGGFGLGEEVMRLVDEHFHVWNNNIS